MTNVYCPLNLMMLLHHHTTPTPYAQDNPLHAASPAVREGREMLLEEGMIKPDGDLYITTERGAAFIDHLMTVPFPVSRWVIPEMPSSDRDAK